MSQASTESLAQLAEHGTLPDTPRPPQAWVPPSPIPVEIESHVTLEPTPQHDFGKFSREIHQMRAWLAQKPTRADPSPAEPDSQQAYLQAEESAWLVFQDSELAYGLPKHRQLDLLEVYAGQDSRLTTAVRDAGGLAERFTLADGDLTTPEAQRKLCRMLQQFQPRHIWVAPECKLWSSWTFLNQSRSPEHLHKYTTARKADEVHLRLCARLHQWQVSQGRQFHLEQPVASQMLQQDALRTVLEGCHRVNVDMCQFGLRAPVSKKPLRKRTCILTTCPTLSHALQSKMCTGSHDHQVIEGITKFNGHTMNLSKYAASYCFGFARAVARVILQQDPMQQALPVEADPGAGPTPLTRKRFKTNSGWSVPIGPLNLNKRRAPGAASQGAAQRVRTDPPAPAPGAEAHPSQPLLQLPHEVWGPVFEAARETAPRQGSCLAPATHRLQQLVQEALPDVEVLQIFVGRQLRKLQTPLGALSSVEAPTRISVAMMIGPQRFLRVSLDNRAQMSPSQRNARIPEAELLITAFTRTPSSLPEGSPGQSPTVPDRAPASVPVPPGPSESQHSQQPSPDSPPPDLMEGWAPPVSYTHLRAHET